MSLAQVDHFSVVEPAATLSKTISAVHNQKQLCFMKNLMDLLAFSLKNDQT
jgi:hypothetical protein